MNDKVKELRNKAEEGRALYRMGEVEMAEAKEMVMPYLEAVNDHAKELAKKYNMKAHKVSFYSFVR